MYVYVCVGMCAHAKGPHKCLQVHPDRRVKPREDGGQLYVHEPKTMIQVCLQPVKREKVKKKS